VITSLLFLPKILNYSIIISKCQKKIQIEEYSQNTCKVFKLSKSWKARRNQATTIDWKKLGRRDDLIKQGNLDEILEQKKNIHVKTDEIQIKYLF
jgi:hypothetical protein